MTQQTIEIIFEAILILIGLYLAFFKSYFSEKGKNLATKEDIGDITSKVEKIKNEFIKETERLKIDLQYTNQIKFSLRSEKIKSVFECYEKYYIWLNTILNYHFPSASLESKNTLENSYSSFQLAQAKFSLMIDDQPIIDHLNKMQIETLKLDGLCKIKSHEYQSTEYDIEDAKKTTDINARRNELRKAYDNQLAFMRDYNEKKISQYKEIVPMNIKFRDLCNKLIIPLSEKDSTDDS